MPVYEVRYKPWEGQLTPLAWRWLAIPKYSLLALSSKMLNWSVFGVGSLQLVGYTVFLFVTNNAFLLDLLELGKVPKVAPESLIRSFLYIQTFLSLAPLVMSAPRLIAPERQHGALAILYARPITRLGYLFGKYSAAAAIMSFLTWVQVLVLWVVMYVTYLDTSPFHAQFSTVALPVLAKGVGYGMLVAAALSSVAMCASSLTNNSAFAAGQTMSMIFGSSVVGAFLGAKVATPLYAIGIMPALQALGDNFFNKGADALCGPTAAFMGVAFWISVPLAIAYWRIRPLEVHKD